MPKVDEADIANVDVTPDMIEAGCEASRLYDRDDPKEWEIAAIYRAMERARRAG